MSPFSAKAVRFWPFLVLVLVTDLVSKGLAEKFLSPPGSSHDVLGKWVRLTLTFNQGGALGIPTGRVGFLILIGFSVVLVSWLALLYRRLPQESTTPASGLGLLIGGALGNLWGRVMVQEGVVDFIDIGMGSLRFWTFNLADTGITLGAAVLGWWFWRRGGNAHSTEESMGQES